MRRVHHRSSRRPGGTLVDMSDDWTPLLGELPPPIRDCVVERLKTASPAEREEMRLRIERRMSQADGGHMQRVRRDWDARLEAEARAPEAGDPAPNFDLALLNGDGQRVRLSALRGRPVGLIFGSYT
jgi:hypothetical protein